MRLRVVAAVCVIAALSTGCSRFGWGRQHQAAIHPIGSWAVAASGDFQGHHWVRYASAASVGSWCFALTLDGRNAQIRTLPSHGPVPVFQRHVPLCGLVEAPSAPVDVVNVPPIELKKGQAAAAAVGFLAGIVPTSNAVVATFDDGSKQTALVVSHAFNLFYRAGHTVVSFATTDAAGNTLATCTVHANAPPALATANC